MKLQLQVSVPHSADADDTLIRLLATANQQTGITITVPGRGPASTGSPQGVHIDVDLIDVERVG